MKTAASIAGFREVDDSSCNSLGMTSLFYYSGLIYMVSENRAFPDICFFMVISLAKREA
jgi:hypothetical protein